jgi:hypothetical protein
MTSPTADGEEKSQDDDQVVKSGWALPPRLEKALLLVAIVLLVLLSVFRNEVNKGYISPEFDKRTMAYKGHIRILTDVPGKLFIDERLTSPTEDSVYTVGNNKRHDIRFVPDSGGPPLRATARVNGEPSEAPVEVDLRIKTPSRPVNTPSVQYL